MEDIKPPAPRNRIEEALAKAQAEREQALRASEKYFTHDEPLKIIPEPVRQIREEVVETKAPVHTSPHHLHTSKVSDIKQQRTHTNAHVEPKRPERIERAEKNELKEIKKTRSVLHKTFRLVVALLILGLIIYGGYLAYKKIISPTTATNDTALILGEVGKTITLPTDEDPTIMTVTNLTPLKSQAFFKDAQVGDKVIIYSKSKRAILYRPSENRVIVIAPLNN